MQVESYKVEEVKDELNEMVADSNACELIASLGLHGQQKLVNGQTDSRMAFRKMTEVEGDVFAILFPEHTKIEKFDAEIIPVRVLQLYKEALDSGMFVRFEVWHARTRKEDPILVAFVGTNEPKPWDADYITITARYLIARWGDALAPFQTLCEQAKKLWIAQEKLDAQKEINKAQERLSLIEQEAEVKFSTT